LGSSAVAQGLRPEQQVLFAPSIVSLSASGEWSMSVQGRVFKAPDRSPKRQMFIDMLASAANAPRNDPLYRSRAGYFVSDGNRNRAVSIVLGERVAQLTPSDAAGNFVANLVLSAEQVAQLARDGRIAFESAPSPGNPHRYRGSALVVPEAGITVVTDMDDTIKETHIRNHAEAKANTFVRPFRPVAGMPELYRAWQAAPGPHIHFHVVSAGPWQFHEPLRRFTEESGFPDFTWDMRSVDLPQAMVVIKETLLADPQRLYEFKLRAIRALIARLPKRQFVLVGDSGEKDPEVYAAIVSALPQRVDAVYIRNVSGEGQDAARYQKLFADPVAAAKLRVFVQPDELPRSLGGVR